MSWWPKKRKTPELSEEQLEQQGPRSTLLPPPPSGVESAPRTMRVPAAPAGDAGLALIDAAMSDDYELDLDYEAFGDDDEDDTRPTLRRTRGVVPATPTMPCRFC